MMNHNCSKSIPVDPAGQTFPSEGAAPPEMEPTNLINSHLYVRELGYLACGEDTACYAWKDGDDDWAVREGRG